MHTDRYLACIEADAAAILDVIATTPEDAPVPSCPGWSLRDLVLHTGAVHRHKTETVRDRWQDGEPPWIAGAEGFGDDIDDLAAWFSEGLSDMLDVFRTADLSAPSWTWCAHEHTADWWVRRMAHETVIHGADAVLAAGGTPRVPVDLALDGIDEVLHEMMVGGPDWGFLEPQQGVVALEAGGRRWLLRKAAFSGTSPNTGTTYEGLDALLEETDGQADATVSLEPGTMDLWLWGRTALPAGAVSGDEALVAYVRAVAAEATQ